MSSYQEKLINARNQLDHLVNLYVEKANTLVKIPSEKIYMKFSIGNQDYVAFSDELDDVEEMNIMFAKADLIDDKRIVRNIENREEYDEVISVFNRIIGLMEQ